MRIDSFLDPANGARLIERARTAPHPLDDGDALLDAGDISAPVEDAAVRAVVGEPEMPAPTAADESLFSDAQRGVLTTLADLLGAQRPAPLPAAPLGGTELAPVGDRELAPANDGPAAQAGPAAGDAAMRALRGFLGGAAAFVAADAFDFASVAGDAERAGTEETLDPFLDAVDPAWMDEVMLTLLPNGDIIPDPTSDMGSDPMAQAPVDGVDGWVL